MTVDHWISATKTYHTYITYQTTIDLHTVELGSNSRPSNKSRRQIQCWFHHHCTRHDTILYIFCIGSIVHVAYWNKKFHHRLYIQHLCYDYYHICSSVNLCLLLTSLLLKLVSWVYLVYKSISSCLSSLPYPATLDLLLNCFFSFLSSFSFLIV